MPDRQNLRLMWEDNEPLDIFRVRMEDICRKRSDAKPYEIKRFNQGWMYIEWTSYKPSWNKKAKPKSQSLSRSHIRDLEFIILSRNRHLRFLADEWNSGYWMCSDCSRMRPLLSLNNANFLSHWTSLLFQHTQKMLLGILKWKGRMDGSRNWTPRKIQGEHTLCSPG